MSKPKIVLALVVVGALVGAACQSKEERLFAARRDAQGRLDALYARYGGGDFAGAVRADAKKGEAELKAAPDAASAVELLRMVGAAAGEVDRVAFEEQCASIGRGERPMILNDKAKAFFADPAVASDCGAIAIKLAEVAALEREFGLQQGPQ